MTRGEKIAWIWVWSTVTVLSVAVAFTAWRYWVSPAVYLNSFLCSTENTAVAGPACERVLLYDSATRDMRLTAHRRLGAIAQYSGKYETAITQFGQLILLGGANDDDWNERGLSYYYSHDYEKAANHFRQAAIVNSSIGAYWSNIGDAQVETGKFGEAIQNYTTAMRKGFRNAEVLGNRAWARYQLGSYINALADYDKAIVMDAEHADNFNERGLVRHAQQDYRAAIADFDQALKLNKDSFIFLTNRAASHSRLAQIDKARQDLDRAISLNAEYKPARLDKAWLLIDQRQPEQALLELKQLDLLGPLDMRQLEARGQAHFDLGHWKETIADVDQAIKLGSQSVWLYQLRASTKFELADYEGAVADATIVLKNNPANADAFITRAYSLELSGKVDAAFDDLDDALKVASDPAFVYEARSYLNIAAGRLAEAVSDARQSVALAPQSVDSSVVLGWALLENGEPPAALSECDRALSLREADFVYRCRALAKLALQQPALAFNDASRALGLNKAAGNNHYVLGRVELAQGKVTSAIARFDEALRIGTYDRAVIFMYRGDAERALGDLAQARLDYQEAKKRDLGLYAKALDERLAALPQQ